MTGTLEAAMISDRFPPGVKESRDPCRSFIGHGVSGVKRLVSNDRQFIARVPNAGMAKCCHWCSGGWGGCAVP